MFIYLTCVYQEVCAPVTVLGTQDEPGIMQASSCPGDLIW